MSNTKAKNTRGNARGDLVKANATRNGPALNGDSVNDAPATNNVANYNSSSPAFSHTLPTTDFNCNNWIDCGMPDCSPPSVFGPAFYQQSFAPQIWSPGVVTAPLQFSSPTNTARYSMLGNPYVVNAAGQSPNSTGYQLSSPATTSHPWVATAPSQIRNPPTTAAYPMVGGPCVPSATDVLAYASPNQPIPLPLAADPVSTTSTPLEFETHTPADLDSSLPFDACKFDLGVPPPASPLPHPSPQSPTTAKSRQGRRGDKVDAADHSSDDDKTRKRKRNTNAARKYRQKKDDHLQKLQADLDEANAQKLRFEAERDEARRQLAAQKVEEGLRELEYRRCEEEMVLQMVNLMVENERLQRNRSEGL